MTSQKPAQNKIDLHESDKKIPQDLIISYKGQKHILKAGLEWKANDLFGGAGYSLTVEPLLMNHEQGHYIIMARLTVIANGAVYENIGEAKIANVNPLMKSQLLHLAVTRAECRVLRMATACGYASYDEVRTADQNDKPVHDIENGDAPASIAQKKTIKAMGGIVKTGITRQEAVDLISKLATKTK